MSLADSQTFFANRKKASAIINKSNDTRGSIANASSIGSVLEKDESTAMSKSANSNASTAPAPAMELEADGGDTNHSMATVARQNPTMIAVPSLSLAKAFRNQMALATENGLAVEPIKPQSTVLGSPAAIPELNLAASYPEMAAAAAKGHENEMVLASRLFALEFSYDKRLTSIEKTLKSIAAALPSNLPATPPESEDGHAPPDTTQKVKELEKVELSFEDASTATTYVPLVVREMASLSTMRLDLQPIPLAKMKPFNIEFLRSFLGGVEYCNGMFYTPGPRSTQIGKMMQNSTYYLLDRNNDPYLPEHPGEHGAKLAVIMRELTKNEFIENVPLFIANGDGRYVYMGHYSQTRWSDRLDYERSREVVPVVVKEFWAEKLTDSKRHDWITNELKVALCDKPKYTGEIPVDDGGEGAVDDWLVENGGCVNGEKVKADVKDFLMDMEDWEDEAATLVKGLTKAQVMDAFERVSRLLLRTLLDDGELTHLQGDSDEEPALRFWWEYLECIGFDRNFYYILNTAMESGTQVD